MNARGFRWTQEGLYFKWTQEGSDGCKRVEIDAIGLKWTQQG